MLMISFKWRSIKLTFRPPCFFFYNHILFWLKQKRLNTSFWHEFINRGMHETENLKCLTRKLTKFIFNVCHYILKMHVYCIIILAIPASWGTVTSMFAYCNGQNIHHVRYEQFRILTKKKNFAHHWLLKHQGTLKCCICLSVCILNFVFVCLR
jgi:hypothetical protein